MPSLKQKAYIGFFWSVVERFGIRGVSLFFSIFLARILSPEEYGIVAMPMFFLSIADCLIDCGFGGALIRRKELSEQDLNTAFYFNLSVGFVCFGGLCLASPWISRFYNAAILEDLVKISALSTLMGPLGMAQGVLLTREVDFKRLAKISLISALVSGVMGIVLALNGWGVWALVIQGLGGQIVRIILLWSMVSWRPKLMWSNDSFRYLFGFGSKMMVSGLFNVAYENVYPMVIGRCFAPAALGNFMKGYSLATIPSLQATDVLQRVTYPVLCKMQDDDDVLAMNYRKMLRLSAFLVFPLMIGLAAAAKPFVAVLLGEQWDGVVVILQVLCIGMMFYPIHAINLNLLQVKGRSDLFLFLEIIKGVMGVVALIIAVPRGIMWMVGSVLVLSVLALVVNTFFTGVLINVGFFRQMIDLTPILMSSFLMGGVVWLVNSIGVSSFVVLPLDILIGVLVYYFASLYFCKDMLVQSKDLLSDFINKAKL